MAKWASTSTVFVCARKLGWRQDVMTSQTARAQRAWAQTQDPARSSPCCLAEDMSMLRWFYTAARGAKPGRAMPEPVRVCAAAAPRRERAARSAKGAGKSHPRDVVDVVGVIADDGHHDGIGHLLHAAADDLDRAHLGASSFSAARFVRTAGCA